MMMQRRALVKPRFIKMLLFVAVLAVFCTHPLQAQQKAPSIIRDTEIENIFKTWTAPLLKQAGIPQGSVQIVLVQSPQVNAFVAGGANIFFYTGLIEKTDGPEEILGVLAHEIGHIAGGHLIKTRDAMERASYESMLGMVVGIGAAVLTGEGEVAGAVIGGSQSMATRRFLSHSRIHESSADQAAYSYLSGAGLTSKGLSSFFGKLQSQELLPSSQQSEYVRTHPITRDRIDAVNALMEKHPELNDKALPDKWVRDHKLMKAKLVGFINPGQVAWTYDDRDQSIYARYARTIAAYRQNEISEALRGIDELIAEEPDNAYFYELKGQMLADFSRIEESIAPYQKSVSLLPDAPLLRIALAHVLIESGQNQKRLESAVSHLQRAMKLEQHSSRAHRLLATAYGRLGQNTMAKLHLAEEAVLQRNLPYAHAQASRALSEAKPNSREWIKAKDILGQIDNLKATQG